ncbi:MAG TPA: glutamate 5-kinase [Acidimicrobiales bacterium]|nr:glutamate 5-kinase [Acidimicrobiales bacterium]
MAGRSAVVKVGTTSVTDAAGGVDAAVLAALAADVAAARADGWSVVVVTSGAITAGWAEVGAGRARPHDAQTLQAVSAVGQPRLMSAWRDAFATVGLAVGQVLLAPLDFSHRGQYLHARDTLSALDALGVVAIVNENDAVADEEIRFGDNDRLAALVANLVAAERLVLLTDTEGLLTADPRVDASATLIEEVARIDAELLDLAGSSRSGVGSGGMASKLAAARIATWSGVTAVIAPARAANAVTAALAGQPGFGTTFTPRSTRLSARKAWIAFAVASRGTLSVNAGARSALTTAGRSLLAVGVTGATGDFVEGDAVEVLGPAGEVVAKGLARVGRDELDGYDDVVVHRDDLVLLADADRTVTLDG